MIDWISAEVACDYQGVITGGEVLMLDADGSLEWSRERWRGVPGSHSSTVQVQGLDDGRIGCRFKISGNPSKFLQGHNLFGCSDINFLVGRMMDVITARLGLVPSDNDRASWYGGAYILSRVDVTRMYDLGTPRRVLDWLTSASQVAHSRYQSAGNEHGTTLYVGKHSRRVSLKIYDKLSEMRAKGKGHSLPVTLPKEHYHLLDEWVPGKLRVEAVFRSMWLKDHYMAVGFAWSPGLAEAVLDERVEGLEMSDTMRLSDEYVGELPGKLVVVYDAWRAGRDIRSMFCKRTFYRYRSQLLSYGIDIAHVRPREVVAENQYLLGAPLKSFLQGDGVPVPEWAIGTPMYVAS
jgi:II/X family phage/plasmid replication protein